MEKKRHVFPLVADNEPVIVPDRQMQLYENGDLITRIRGDYRDKVYHDFAPYPKSTSEEGVTKSRYQSGKALKTQPREISKGREEAKRDIKQKRQAIPDKKPVSTVLPVSKKAPLKTQNVRNELSRFGKQLEQESYILAELPRVYASPQNPLANVEPKKNSFDFLKKSQIYNREERQVQKERQVAQELNLTRFEE